jgi:hypothetical protein
MMGAKIDHAGDPVGCSARSPHAFMREALGAKSRLVEQRQAFLRAALAAEDDALVSNLGHGAADVDAYFDARSAEQCVPLPSAARWRS